MWIWADRGNEGVPICTFTPTYGLPNNYNIPSQHITPPSQPVIYFIYVTDHIASHSHLICLRRTFWTKGSSSLQKESFFAPPRSRDYQRASGVVCMHIYAQRLVDMFLFWFQPVVCLPSLNNTQLGREICYFIPPNNTVVITPIVC